MDALFSEVAGPKSGEVGRDWKMNYKPSSCEKLPNVKNFALKNCLDGFVSSTFCV